MLEEQKKKKKKPFSYIKPINFAFSQRKVNKNTLTKASGVHDLSLTIFYLIGKKNTRKRGKNSPNKLALTY